MARRCWLLHVIGKKGCEKARYGLGLGEVAVRQRGEGEVELLTALLDAETPGNDGHDGQTDYEERFSQIARSTMNNRKASRSGHWN